MTITHHPGLLAALALMLATTAQTPAFAADTPTPGYNHKIPDKTPDSVDSRIGALKFFDGFPTAETSQKLYDNLDYMRAVEVFLNFIPAASLEAMRLGMAEQGATKSNQVMLFDKLADSSPLFLTANTDTVYAFAMLDLERDGPTVIEIPKGTGPGTLDDAFFRFITDMGRPGPDKGQGGKYLILPPAYTGAVPDGYFVSRSPSYVNWMALRSFLVDGKPDFATKNFKDGLKIYPLAQAANPPKMEFISASGKAFNTIHANNAEFYDELAHVIAKEPVDLFDPELRGLAASIGLRKGQPFAPDARMKAILADAAKVANATSRAIVFQTRDSLAYYYDRSQWKTAFVGADYKWLIDQGAGGRNIDGRTGFFYQATVNTPAMALKMPGVGSQYAYAERDSDGNYLDGGKNYRLNIPANVPAKDFWSVVIYDPQTRSELQTGQPYPSKNNKRDKMIVNADGSIDLYSGPKAPAGKAANWTQTVPNKGWYTLFRLYGPLEPWFDKTWRPGEIQLVR